MMDVEISESSPLVKMAINTPRQEWRRRIPLPSIRIRTSERRLILGLVDLLMLAVALIAAVLIWTDYPHTVETFTANWKWFVTLAVVWSLCALFFDVYDLARAASTSSILPNISLAVLAAVLIYIFIPSLTPPLQSRGLVFSFGGLALMGVVVWRASYALLFVQPWFKQRALMVGAGWAGCTMADALAKSPHDANPYRGTGYELVGFIDDNPDLLGRTIAGAPVLADHTHLLELARRLEIDEIILAITHRHAISDELFDALLRCRECGYPLISMPTLYERLLGCVPVQHLGRDIHLIIRDSDLPSDRFYHLLIRLFDIATALLCLLLLVPTMGVVALANARSSPGPLFYRQRRVGYGGRTFSMLKFRTMWPDAEKDTGVVWAQKNDCRITPIGRILRPTRLDELPQCINVLRGQMSMIGPRPERPEFTEQLAARIPFYRARHAVRPGITGWAQVRYRYGNDENDARIKLEYDLYYVRHRSIWLDLSILLKTLLVMLQFKGN
ncbi:MAG: sugar transferase [Halieaceae bacterium]|nr:sugar transferase [Halieaceae bacterium]